MNDKEIKELNNIFYHLHNDLKYIEKSKKQKKYKDIANVSLSLVEHLNLKILQLEEQINTQSLIVDILKLVEEHKTKNQ